MGEFTSNGVAVEYIYIKYLQKFIICLQKDGKIIVRIMENFPIVETKAKYIQKCKCHLWQQFYANEILT